MAMSVATTKHLRTIGLFDSYENDPGKNVYHSTLFANEYLTELCFEILLDVDINFLMTQSLRTVMSLPLHLVLDTWRWKILKGDVPVKQWNREFWNQRYNYKMVLL